MSNEPKAPDNSKA